MPEDTQTSVRLPLHEGKAYKTTRTKVLSEAQGITALIGQPEDADAWEIRTVIFAKEKWDLETARKWLAEHKDELSTSQQMPPDPPPLPDADPGDAAANIDLPDGDLPKYIEVRQYPPGKFSSYQHRWEDKARGILKSVGIWKKTGAVVVQKLLFRRDAGWTDETVKAWFDDHPEYHYPHTNGLFFALSDDAAETLLADGGDLFLLETLFLPTTPATPMLDVLILRSGWGKNQRRGPDGLLYRDYFTPEFLRTVVHQAEGSPLQTVQIRQPQASLPVSDVAKGTADALAELGHPPETVNLLLPRGLTGNTIGFLKNVRVEDFATPQIIAGQAWEGSAVRADVILANTDEAARTRQLFETAWQHGLQSSLGLSINYKATVDWTVRDGQRACVFLNCTRMVSTEVVCNPAAGGIILGTKGALPMKHVTQATTDEHASVVSGQPPIEATPPAATGSPATGTDQSVQIAALQTQLADHAAALRDREFLAQQVAATQADLAALKAAKLQNDLTLLVMQAALKDEAKTQLVAKIAKGDLTSADELNFLLGFAQAAQPVMPTPVFPGLAGAARVVKDPKDVLKVRTLLNWELPLTQAEEDLRKQYNLRRFNGIQEEYITLTGDHGLRMHGLSPQYFAQQIHPDLVQHQAFVQDDGNFTQTQTTATYTDFLTHILNRSLEIHYRTTDKSWEAMVKMGDPYSDNRSHEEWILGQFPEIAAVSEGGTYQEIAYGKVEKLTNTSQKYGNLLQITEEVIQDDNLSYVKNMVSLMADAMNRTVFRKVMDKVTGASSNVVNAATMADTIAGALYSAANRANYVDGSIENFDKLVELVNLMLAQKDLMDSAGNEAPIILQPWLFIGDIRKIGKVRARIKGPTEPGRTDQLPNTLYMTNIPDANFIGVHPAYLYNHPEMLIVLPNPAEFAGLKLSYFRGMDTPELIWEGNQAPNIGSAFASDVLKLRMKFKFRLAYQRMKAFYGMYVNA